MSQIDGTFRLLQPKRIPAQVAETIIDSIRRGDFVIGSRLPAQRDLAVTLGVSRSSLREALASLELAGIVDSHQGRGTTVIADVAQIDAWGRSVLPPQVLEVRLLIEPELAALAAAKRTPETVRMLEVSLAQLELRRLDEGVQFDDHFFHRAIAEAAQNPILQRALDEALSYTSGRVWVDLKTKALSRHGAVEGHMREARAVVAAIANGDSRTASEIWRDHLVGYRLEMLAVESTRAKDAQT
jgi:GntR family transcriptional repressor for pyruvate dehydrogenase complex